MKTNHNQNYPNSRRKALRKNSTPQEHILWARVRGKQLGFKFYRQYSIGHYIVDFYCPAKKLIIELDGSQHLDNREYDLERTNFLNMLNYKVLRFWNDEINKNLSEVLEVIMKYLRS